MATMEGAGAYERCWRTGLPTRFRKRLPVGDIKLRSTRNLCSRARRGATRRYIAPLNNDEDEIAAHPPTHPSPPLRAARQIETSNSRNLYYTVLCFFVGFHSRRRNHLLSPLRLRNSARARLRMPRNRFARDALRAIIEKY